LSETLSEYPSQQSILARPGRELAGHQWFGTTLQAMPTCPNSENVHGVAQVGPGQHHCGHGRRGGS